MEQGWTEMLGSSRSTAGSEGWEHAHMFSTRKQKREGGDKNHKHAFDRQICDLFWLFIPKQTQL